MKHTAIKMTLLILIVCIAACKKPGPTTVYLNTDFKKYFNYQVGSYWIMYDSVNNHTDSLVVVQYVNTPPYYNSSDANEYVYVVIKDYVENANSDTVTWILTLTAPYYSHLGYNSSIIPFTDFPFFVYNIPFDNDTNVYHYPISTIEGLSYTNVYRARVQYPNDFFFINAYAGFLEILVNDQYLKKKLFLLSYYF